MPPRTPARAPRAWPPRGPHEALLRWGPQCWFRSRASEEEPLGADGWQVPETPSPELSPRTRGDEALLPAGVLGSTRRRASEVLGVVPGPAAPASVTWALGQSNKPRPHPGPAESGTRGGRPSVPVASVVPRQSHLGTLRCVAPTRGSTWFIQRGELSPPARRCCVRHQSRASSSASCRFSRCSHGSPG